MLERLAAHVRPFWSQSLPAPGTQLPGPPGVWGLRNLLAAHREGLEFFSRLAREYGDVVHLRFGGLDVYQLSHPDHIEEVLRRQAQGVIKDVPTRSLSRALGQGLVTSDGALWRSHRKLASFAFTPRRVAGYADTMVTVAQRALEGWRDDTALDIHAEMSRITLDLVAEVLFGTDLDRRQIDTVARSMRTLNDTFANSWEMWLGAPDWLPTPGMRRFHRAVAAIDEVVYWVIDAKRRAAGRDDDLLSALIAARDNDADADLEFSDRELRDHCVTLLLAGHETTSLALVHALYFLSRHPDVEARFHAELDEVLGDRPATARDAGKLRYTERILKEAMRLLPPVWGIGREALQDMDIAGHHMPKGAQMIMCQWIVHRDGRWYRDPDRFDPDRWTPERSTDRPKLAYFPFGAGPRICIGNHFAMLEAVLLLALIGQRWQLRLLPGQGRQDFLPSVTIQPRHGGWRMRVREREN